MFEKVVGGRWSVVGKHLAKEAVGMWPLSVNGSFDYAQDDGVGKSVSAGLLRAGNHCFPRVTPLKRL